MSHSPGARCLPGLALLAALAASPGSQGATDHEARAGRYLTVCGDPNNLPFSNEQLEGFENRIAVLIAGDLNRTLHYRWWPQSVGFIRNTLQTRLCDVIMGISAVNDLVQNTNPYYRSVYTLIYRADAGRNRLAPPVLSPLADGVT